MKFGDWFALLVVGFGLPFFAFGLLSVVYAFGGLFPAILFGVLMFLVWLVAMSTTAREIGPWGAARERRRQVKADLHKSKAERTRPLRMRRARK